MKLNQSSLITMRKAIKTTSNRNAEMLRKFKNALEYALKLAVPYYVSINHPEDRLPNSFDTKTFIDKVNEVSPLEFPHNLTVDDVIAILRGNIIGFSTNIAKQKHLLKAIKDDGIDRITYSLPMLLLTYNDVHRTITRLTIMGIKKNAESKNESDEMVDEREVDLLAHERTLGTYIDDDFRIAIEDTQTFIEQFAEYLMTYYNSMKFAYLGGSKVEDIIKGIKVMLGFHIIESQTDANLELQSLKLYKKLVERFMKEDMSLEEAIVFVSNYVSLTVKDFNDAIDPDKRYLGKDGYYIDTKEADERYDRNISTLVTDDEKREKIQAIKEEEFGEYDGQMLNIVLCLELLSLSIHRAGLEEKKMKEESSKKTDSRTVQATESKLLIPNPLDEFVARGQVVALCNEEKFEELLSLSDLTESKKQELRVQMKNLRNRLAQEELNRRLEESRIKNLSARQLKLYELAKCNRVTGQIVKDIDAIIEMMLDDLSEEDLEILKEELEPLFDYLEIIFAPAKKETETIYPIIYFREKVIVDGKEQMVPRLLTSLIKDKKAHYKQAYTTLTKFIQGNLTGDRELHGNNLPCRLFIKGSDFRFFYTIIDDKAIIMDGIVGDDSCFAKAIKIAQSKDFRNFLDSVKRGTITPDNEYTDSIIKELEKSKKVSAAPKF